ncbi:cell division protein FtsL [Aurantivibrio plasticivorans]
MSQTNTGFVKRAMLIAALWLMLVVSGLSVVYVTHVSRQLMNELQVAKRETAALHTEWGQYLLEKSTWAAYNRVENVANTQLDMQVPAQDKVVVITQ